MASQRFAWKGYKKNLSSRDFFPCLPIQTNVTFRNGQGNSKHEWSVAKITVGVSGNIHLFPRQAFHVTIANVCWHIIRASSKFLFFFFPVAGEAQGHFQRVPQVSHVPTLQTDHFPLGIVAMNLLFVLRPRDTFHLNSTKVVSSNEHVQVLFLYPILSDVLGRDIHDFNAWCIQTLMLDQADDIGVRS